MLKTLLVSTALVAGTSALAMATPAMQTGRSATVKAHKSRVTASGRCKGVSYGTGQRSCGTVTGGTPGGNPSRN